jgi:hypothetical protein
MKKITLLFSAALFAVNLNAQTRSTADESAEAIRKKSSMDLTTLPNGWKKGGNLLLGFNATNQSFWQGASEKYNAVFNGGLTYNATRKHNKTLWLNDLNYAYTSQASQGTEDQFRTSSDLLTLSSMYAPQIKPKWFVGINGDLRTQLFNSYNYSNPSLPVQTGSFLTNGGIRVGVGIMYTPTPKFRVYFSPLTANITTKLGSWAKPLVLGGVAANETVKFGLGSLLRMDYQNSWNTGTILGKLTYTSRMDLFTDYLDKPFQVIDLDWINSVGCNLTKYISVASQINFRYYDRNIQRLQNQNMFGLGFSYKL